MKEGIFKKGRLKILFLAIVLRLLVSGFLYHPDIKTFNFQSSFLKKGVVNIYPYLIENRMSLPLKEEFVYFPLSYFVVGGYQAIVSPLLGQGLDNWLANADSVTSVTDPNIFWYLIFLKFPLLVVDIAIAFLLLKFFKDEKDKEKAFTFWLFNPFTIILIYAFSNIDIYSVFLTLVAFLFLKRKKLLSALVFLGLAACFKAYPLIFLPFIFLKAKNTKQKILSVLIPLFILFLTIVPFWSTAFVQSALVSGLTTRIFNPGILVGFGESIMMGLLILSALFFSVWLHKKDINLFNYWVVFLLIIFSFSHFHISWLLWIAPFLLILIVKNSKLTWPVVLLCMLALAIPLLYEDRNMTISLFRIYTTWYDLLPTPFAVMEKFYDPYNFQSILHTLFAGGAGVISYKLLSEKKD
ncbi:hypothetical protein ISR94_01290 [Candidatus Microgenomates bacterium]|nr:hypothetical protein [Candidatus Microgenomates bacterium]